MEINNILEAVYKELLEINKIAPYLLGSFALIVFAIRNVYAHRFAMNYQEKFGVPHHRFSASFNKDLVEILLHMAMLLLFIVSQYIFAINYSKIDEVICAILCTFFVAGYNFVVLTMSTKKNSMKYVWLVTIIVTVLVIAAVGISFAFFPLTKENYNVVEILLIVYSVIAIIIYFMYLIVSFTYIAYKSFGENAEPQSGEYEVVTINDNKYVVILNTKDETILVKLKDENGKLHIIKSDYMIVKSIEGKNIEYREVIL